MMLFLSPSVAGAPAGAPSPLVPTLAVAYPGVDWALAPGQTPSAAAPSLVSVPNPPAALVADYRWPQLASAGYSFADLQAAAKACVDRLTAARGANGLSYGGLSYPLDGVTQNGVHVCYHRADTFTYPYPVFLLDGTQTTFAGPTALRWWCVALLGALQAENNLIGSVKGAVKAAATPTAVMAALAADTRSPTGQLSDPTASPQLGALWKSGRIATPAVAAGASVTVTVTFPEAYQDANYTIGGLTFEGSALLGAFAWTVQSPPAATGFTISLKNVLLVSLLAGAGKVHWTTRHD